MIVCICHRVSDRDIARAAQGGCASFDELQFELLVGTSCGKCHDCARETFHRHAAQAAGLGLMQAQQEAACCTAPHPGLAVGSHHPREALAAAGA